MNTIGKILLKGLVTVLPIGLTLYFIYWLVVSLEEISRTMIIMVMPAHYYVPGLGLLCSLILLFVAGLIVNALIVQKIIRASEDLLSRIPLVKSIYGGLRDFLAYFSPEKNKDELKKVVLVNIYDTQLIGFITGNIDTLPDHQQEDRVAVYLPMSYQLGGYTVYVKKNTVETIDMSVEDAMRHVLTAGLSKEQ